MKLRGLLVAILLVLGCRQGSAEPTVRDGDIIFQTSQSAQSQAIQAATRSPYSHMGLILLRGGRPFVLETISHVQLTPLATWAARGSGGRYVVKRLREDAMLSDPSKMSALRKAAMAFVGKPYDPYFEWSDDRIYCSELVWKAFDRGLGIQIGALAPLSSFDLDSRIVRIKLAERYGQQIPLSEQVISPAAIFDSPLLVQAP